MPLYSCAIVGTGTEADPIRPPFNGNGSGWICLAPPGSTSGRGILYLPIAQSDARLRKLCDDPTERLTNQVRNTWQNELGITLASVSTATMSAVLAEILKDHGRADGSRWGVLLPSKARQRWEIYLGALGAIWTLAAPPTPSTQSFTETWPTDSGTISSGQDQAWTEQGVGLEVSGGKIRPDNTGAVFNTAKCDSVLDTANQFHQADFTIANTGSLLSIVQAAVRHADADNLYRMDLRWNAGAASRATTKRVAGANTTFASDSTSPGTSGTMKFIVDGSTITGQLGGVTILGPTTDASPQLLTNFNGGVQLISSSGIGNATLDNHTIADVVNQKNTRSWPLGTEVGMGWRMEP